MIDIIRGTNDSPVSTESLIELLKSNIDTEGILYIGYPILGNSSDRASLDAIFISVQYDVVIFDIVEGANAEKRSDVRDELWNLLHSRLISHKELAVQRGKLAVDINVLTYAPAANCIDEEVVDMNGHLIEKLNDLLITPKDRDSYRRVLQAIQAVTKLKYSPKRKVSKEKSKGAKLNQLENSISNLDQQQSKAVIETSSGIQRIRGLAGSGKTIVLALKVAYLHSKYRDWKIGVTFYTRALKEQFVNYITKFTIEQSYEEPNWDNINIMQAWGGVREPGFYYEFCLSNNVEFLNFNDAKHRFTDHKRYLSNICKKAIAEVTEDFVEKYDIILIDEAQDFSEQFLKLCYLMLRSHDKENSANKRLIYAYDELQNLNQNTLRSPKEIFNDKIDFSNEENRPLQDITLEKCYRNSGPLLVAAHALGFGIYRQEGPITMFKEKEIWQDVGYKVESGNLELGSNVVLKRDHETSPEYYKDIAPVDELIIFKEFENATAQMEWVAEEIRKNLFEDELRPTDIIIIHPDALSAKKNLAPLRGLLFKKGIDSHIAGVTTSPDSFIIEGSIACTSIYRAKGNEAPMVYIIDADYCHSGWGLITKRNILFTAMTRSKCWLRVCGVGEKMHLLKSEYGIIKEKKYRLDFKYPTIVEMEKLNTIHRDLSDDDKRKIKEGNTELKGLIKKLSSGSIKKSDLSEEELSKLKDMLDD